jgi:hypothetical protein
MWRPCAHEVRPAWNPYPSAPRAMYAKRQTRVRPRHGFRPWSARTCATPCLAIARRVHRLRRSSRPPPRGPARVSGPCVPRLLPPSQVSSRGRLCIGAIRSKRNKWRQKAVRTSRAVRYITAARRLASEQTRLENPTPAARCRILDDVTGWARVNDVARHLLRCQMWLAGSPPSVFPCSSLSQCRRGYSRLSAANRLRRVFSLRANRRPGR